MGGGSGGHVTPVVAVLSEIKKIDKDVKIRFWCDKKFYNQAKNVMKSFDPDLEVSRISSGKFRRYHGIPWYSQARHLDVLWANFSDLFRTGWGFLESVAKLLLWRPDVVFTKGGFVCLPVGLAARALNIPLVIHDSDAHPGLTNRILSRFATKVATGAPLKYYPYDKTKAKYVGVPIADTFKRYSSLEKDSFKEELGFKKERKLILVTGGGLGAKRMNDAVSAIYKELVKKSDLILIAGRDQYEKLRKKMGKDTEHFKLYPFVAKDMWKMLAASDVVVTRAGATTLLELAALAKATLIIPNGLLTGGHQLKNTNVYKEAGAVYVLGDFEISEKPEVLLHTLIEMIDDEKLLEDLGNKFHKFSKPNASYDMAKLILSVVKK